MLLHNYPYIVKIEPRTVHAWRQFDCLSFAQNFYNGSATLLEPRINNLGYTGTGKTASEFPIIPFLVGNIWKMTGINSAVYKFINILFLFFDLFFVYKLFLLEIRDKISATLITAFLFTSPILSYYGVSTISDIQSLSLSMIGFYFFYCSIHEKKISLFYIFLLFFALAGLIKASSGVIYLVCIFYFFAYNLQNKHSLFTRSHLVQLALLLIPIFIWYSWYNYADAYNHKNNSGFFLIGLLPIWKLSSAEIDLIIFKFFNNVFPQVLSNFQLYPILAGILLTVLFGGRSNLSIRIILLFCLLLFMAFILLFFEAMDVHDYYLLNVYGLLIISIFLMCKIWYHRFIPGNYKTFIISISVLILLFTYTSGLKTWNKINCNVDNFEQRLVFNTYEQQNYFWIYWLDRYMNNVLEDRSENITEKSGILPDDIVFCLGDNTINRTLYMLNRKGYSNFNVKLKDTPQYIVDHKNIKYVVLIDSVLKKKYLMKPLFQNKVYEKRSLSVYKVN